MKRFPVLTTEKDITTGSLCKMLILLQRPIPFWICTQLILIPSWLQQVRSVWSESPVPPSVYQIVGRWHVDSLHHHCLSGEIIWSWLVVLAAMGSCWGQSCHNWHCAGVITKCSWFNFCTNSNLPHLVVQIMMNTVQLLLVYSFWYCTNLVFSKPEAKCSSRK